jgi:hypothetical protein
MNSKLIIKFNGGRGAILCSKCSVIIKDKDYTKEELDYFKGKIEYLPPQYCKKCKHNEITSH